MSAPVTGQCFMCYYIKGSGIIPADGGVLISGICKTHNSSISSLLVKKYGTHDNHKYHGSVWTQSSAILAYELLRSHWSGSPMPTSMNPVAALSQSELAKAVGLHKDKTELHVTDDELSMLAYAVNNASKVLSSLHKISQDFGLVSGRGTFSKAVTEKQELLEKLSLMLERKLRGR